jgi:outer membrane cobalamin receptor
VLVAAFVGMALAAGSGPAAAEDRKVSAQELVKQGFFSDFDELDLTSLLEGTEITSSVAARRPEPVAHTSGAISLMTAEDIRSLGIFTLEDLLRTLPGFDVVIDNLGHARIIARGIAPSVRGTSEGVLILLNGNRLNEDLDGGATTLNLTIPVSNLHHVEVLRGSASALYGDGAVAAVINLVTDGTSDKERQQGLALSAGYGSFGREHATMEIGSKVGEVWVGGSADFYNTSGAKLLVPTDAQTTRDQENGSGVPPISLAPGYTHDNVRSLETIYRILYKDWKLLWRVKQETSGGYIGETDAFGATGNQIDSRQMLFDLGYERKLQGGLLEAHLRYTDGKSNQLLEVIPPGFRRDLAGGFVVEFPSIFLQSALGSRRYGTEATYSKTIATGHDLSAGVVLERETASDPQMLSNLDFVNFVPITSLQPLAGFPSSARNSLGLWVEDAWRAPWQMTVTGALRLDEIGTGVGGQVSPRLAVVRSLPHDLTARVVYSRSFQAPGFRDLFLNVPGYAPNPDLKTMSVKETEASLSYRKDALQVAGTLYLNWVRNPIVTAGAPSLARPTLLVNGNGINGRGFELSGRRIFGDHSVFLSYALQTPHDTETGLRVADVPTHMATLGGTFLIDRFTVSPTLVLRSARPRDPRDTRPELGGYALLGLTVRHAILDKKLELRGVLDNIFNTRYEDPAPFYGVPGDYPRPGRSVFFDAKYRF